MQMISTYLPYTQLAISLIMVGAILLQQRGAGVGGAFGGGDGFGYSSRRGAEKYMFMATVVIAVLFVLLSILSLLVQK